MPPPIPPDDGDRPRTAKAWRWREVFGPPRPERRRKSDDDWSRPPRSRRREDADAGPTAAQLRAERPAWRRVALGLELKLLALAVGVLVAVAGAAVLYASGGTAGAWESVAQAQMFGLTVALVIDLLGRCCCLFAPPSAGRSALILASVACQVTGFVFVVLALSDSASPSWLLIAIAVGLQVVAAALFVGFLAAVAQHLRRPEVSVLAGTMLAGMLGFIAAAAVVIVITLVLAILLFFAFASGLALLGGAVVLGVLLVACGVVVYVPYAVALVQLSRALRTLGRRPV